MNRLRASGAPFAGRVLAAVLLLAKTLHGQDFAPVDALVAKGELASAASALSEMASKDPKAAKDPKAKALWMRLGDGHYQKKAFREAADAYAKAAEISVDARSPFNAACGYALAGDADKAFAWLEKAAATAAYTPAAIEADGDLASLRKDPRWAPLLEKARLAIEPCRAVPELLQFDFWLGEWRASNGAGLHRRGRIRSPLRVEPGCRSGPRARAELQHVRPGEGAVAGVGQPDARVDFDGALVAEGQMRLVAAKDAQGNLSRMTFTRETPDRVKQHGESSADDGKTWTTTFDFLYERKAPVIAKAEAVLELPRRDVLAEGVAFDPASGAYFVSAVHARSIYRATPSGEVTLFSKKDDGLLGVFGMAVDPKTKSLWAATSGLPEMQGYTPADDDRAFVAQYDLKTGKLVRKVGVPKDGKSVSAT
jgi:tetratricopeptide (TPR) repeat protein